MYEELVETLRETADKRMHDAADAIETMCEMVATAHDELANVIQSYEESKPRWIPVTEEPPLKVGDDGYNGYLVYANGYYEVADYKGYFHVDGEQEPDVTHWMPLPPPPAKEQGR